MTALDGGVSLQHKGRKRCVFCSLFVWALSELTRPVGDVLPSKTNIQIFLGELRGYSGKMAGTCLRGKLIYAHVWRVSSPVHECVRDTERRRCPVLVGAHGAVTGVFVFRAFSPDMSYSRNRSVDLQQVIFIRRLRTSFPRGPHTHQHNPVGTARTARGTTKQGEGGCDTECRRCPVRGDREGDWE